jgi:NAD-dependent DNA ligase
MSLSKKIASAIDLDKKDLESLLKKLSDIYHNGKDSKDAVDDRTYDSLVDIYTEKFGPYKNVGAPVSTADKEKLPKYMGSLNKFKTQEEIDRWTKKYDDKNGYTITDKIDGLSILYTGKKLFTRGDGYYGKNISHLLKYIKFPKITDCFIRGEIYMPKSIFEKKYKNTFANARNMVAGLINPMSKSPNIEAIKDLHIAFYEMDCYNELLNQEDQLIRLSHILEEYYPILHTPRHEYTDIIEIDDLNGIVKDHRECYDYEMDGIVIVHNKATPCVTKDNPLNAFAFKIEDEYDTAIVEYVEWNPTKHGALKPRIKIKPVQLCGVTINWSHGFNAKFIFDNKIAPGRVGRIKRSGCTIPYFSLEPDEDIEDIDLEPDMPKEEYEWNDTGVDIYLLEKTDDVKIEKIISFFETLEAKFVGESTIKKLYHNGFDTLKKIFNASVSDLVKIEGIQQKGADRIVDAVKKCITNVPLSKLTAACGCLNQGFGHRKMQKILDVYPDILDMDMEENEFIELIVDINGFQKKTATQFVKNLPKLKKFIKDHPMISLKSLSAVKNKKKEVEIMFEDSEDKIEEKSNDKKLSISNKTVVFTGVRDKELEEFIEDNGGKVTGAVSSKTHILIVDKRYSGSSKEIKAEKLNIEILTVEEFKKIYL